MPLPFVAASNFYIIADAVSRTRSIECKYPTPTAEGLFSNYFRVETFSRDKLVTTCKKRSSKIVIMRNRKESRTPDAFPGFRSLVCKYFLTKISC
jgi:hypothetical protein